MDALRRLRRHRGMAAAMVAGAAVTLGGVAGAHWIWSADEKTWKAEELARQCPDTPATKWSCDAQLCDRAGDLRDVQSLSNVSSDRQEELRRALTNPASPHFIGARRELEREEGHARELEARGRTLQLDPNARRYQAVGFFLGALISFLLAWLVLRDVDRLFSKKSDAYSGWWLWWIGTVVVVVGTALIGQWISTTTLDKTWFGYDSYCVSPGAFWAVKASILGNQMMAGCVVALFGCATARRHLPTIHVTQRRAGVGDYVDFAKRWTFWGVLVAMVFGCYWLWLALSSSERTSAEKVAYLLPAVGAAMLVAALLWRLLRNMRLLRAKYEEAVAEHGKKAKKKEDESASADPTATYFEDTPWKLPATLVALAAAAWAILDALGVKDVLLGE